MNGIISNMQHFSTGDGPGIRTTIFMQGCNLHCEWCHNPETIDRHPQLLYYESLCTGCGQCVKVCPNGAHTITEKHLFNRSLCTICGACAKSCPSGALKYSGSDRTAEEVMAYILEDIDFYASSGGGVTFSGGEPLLQADFIAYVAKACKVNGIHVLIDTAANVCFLEFEKVLPYTDIFYIDLKAASEEDYKARTGGSLNLVLDNMKKLAVCGCNTEVRIPVIPSLNDSAAYCLKMAELICSTGLKKVSLLPFHRLGLSKYRALEKVYAYEKTVPPQKEQMQSLLQVFKQQGLHTRIDG